MCITFTGYCMFSENYKNDDLLHMQKPIKQ